MKSPRLLAVMAVAAVGVGGAGTAVAAKVKPAPSKVTLKALDGQSFKINRSASSNMRWNHDVYRVKSGGTFTMVGVSKQEPHTWTFLKYKKYLPTTKKQIEATEQCSTKLCQTVLTAQQANPQTGEVKVPIYDTGKPGIDTGATPKHAGDSIYRDPGAKPYKIKVSAKKGTTLYLLCLIHPWMQAKVLVK